MYCVSVAYAREEGCTFDFDYYVNNHVPMVAGFLGDNLIKHEVRKGVAALDGSDAPFVCQASFWIQDVPRLQTVLEERGEQILGDIAHFTNLHPSLQVDEVLV